MRCANRRSSGSRPAIADRGARHRIDRHHDQTADDQHGARDQEALVDVEAEHADQRQQQQRHQVGHPLRDDDGRGARHRDAVRRAQQHGLDRLAQLAGRHRQREAGQEHRQRCRPARCARPPCPGSTASARSARRSSPAPAGRRTGRTAIRTRARALLTGPTPAQIEKPTYTATPTATPATSRDTMRFMAPSHNTPAAPRGGRWRTAPARPGRRARLGVRDGRHGGFHRIVILRYDGGEMDRATALVATVLLLLGCATDPPPPLPIRPVDPNVIVAWTIERGLYEQGVARATEVVTVRASGGARRDARPGLRADPARREPPRAGADDEAPPADRGRAGRAGARAERAWSCRMRRGGPRRRRWFRGRSGGSACR